MPEHLTEDSENPGFYFDGLFHSVGDQVEVMVGISNRLRCDVIHRTKSLDDNLLLHRLRIDHGISACFSSGVC